MSEFYSLITKKGEEEIAKAIGEDRKLKLKYIAVGDGGGEPYKPQSDMEMLKNEVWRGEINSFEIKSESIFVSTIIDADIGGFVIREMGVFDEKGLMIGVCNTPESEKSREESGGISQYELVMEIAVKSENVELIIDRNVIFVTKGEFEEFKKTLKEVAFTGEYEDLKNKPVIPTTLPASGGNADTVDEYHADNFFIRNELNSSTQGIILDDKLNSWIPFKSYRTTPDGKFSAGLAVSYDGGGAIEVRDETDGAAGTIKSRLELRKNGDIIASTGKIIADGGNADTVDGYHAGSLHRVYSGLQNVFEDLSIKETFISTFEFLNKVPGNSSFQFTYNRDHTCTLTDSQINYGVIYVFKGWNNNYHYALAYSNQTYETFIYNALSKTWVNIADNGNADTVDGYHADNLMVYKTNSFNGDIDNLTGTCSLYMQGATSKTIPKSPDKNENVYYGYLTNIRGLNNDWQYQLMKTLAGTLYFRQKKSNVWETAWTAVNDGGNAETARRLNSTIPGSAFSNPQLKGDLKGFNYTYEETLSGTAEHEKSPQPNAQTRSWNIINLAYATNRAAQIAIQTFRPEQKMYFRGRHIDNDDFSTWQEWKEVFTTDKIANNLTTTATGYALDARQGKMLNDKIDSLFINKSTGYSMFYPENDYTINSIGMGDNQGFGYLNLAASVNRDLTLFTVTSTVANSASCRVVGSYTSPTNYITVRQNGLYQIEAKMLTTQENHGAGFRLMIDSNEISEFAADPNKNTSTNVIQYVTAGSKIYLVIEANIASGGVRINKVLDKVNKIFSGIFIKRIM